jgi:tRNA A-37 threonylcarbamoyl transferase component Bud32
MGCLDEQTVVAFVTGGLKGATLAAVEQHLLSCHSCTVLVTVAAPAGVARAAAPTAGTMVGRYRLLHLVGRGAIGEVWAAHDPKFGRKVAVKILRRETHTDRVFSARLLREARAIAALWHPNVIAPYDVGTARGQLFLVMELVEGVTLAAWLDRRRRPLDQILRAFILAGRGLDAAHRAGIVHRDFKPQNVMLGRDRSVRVMDFGLAARGGADPPLTQIGSIVGTPVYMSPEQLRAEPVDARADQYSFCVALYEALYGERPFHGETFASLRAAVLAGRPRPVPAASVVPARLRAVLLRGLAVDRARRFPDMEALLDAIDRAGDRPKRATTRAVLAVATMFLIAGAGVGWRQMHRKRPAPSCARVRDRLASIWPTDDVGARAEMRAAFLASRVPDAHARHERTTRALDAYAKAWTTAATEACEATARVEGRVSGPLAARADCLDDRLAELNASVDLLARGGERGVRYAFDVGESLSPVEACADPATLAARAARPQDPAARERVARLRDRLIRLRLRAMAGYDWRALRPIDELVEQIRALGNQGFTAEALLVSGWARSRFDLEGAASRYEEAFVQSEAVRNDLVAAEAAVRLTAIEGAALHHFDLGSRWARIAEERLYGGPHDRLRSRMLESRGALNAARGAWRMAAADFAAAASVGERAFGDGHPELGKIFERLARANLALELAGPALTAADRALAIAVAVSPAHSPELATARALRGQALLASDRPQEAGPELKASVDELETIVGPDEPVLADALTALGEIALRARRPREARALLRRAWDLQEKAVVDAGVREQTSFSLARALWDGSPAEGRRAMELARQARDGYVMLPDLAPRLSAVQQWIDGRRGVRAAAPQQSADGDADAD